MQVVYSRACGLDVHKASVTACVITFDGKGKRTVRKKEFRTFDVDLNRLMLWLMACKVTHVAMESTGVYWKPVWKKLEGKFELILTNPSHMKAIPGRKTDQQDAEWIAELLVHGLLRASFVPSPQIRQLRELTRLRVHLMGEYNRVHNRIHKVLEDTGIKLSSVVSDIAGVSGRAILRAIIQGEQRPVWLAFRAKGKLLAKDRQEQLQLALRGHVEEHHRFLLEILLNDLEHAEATVARLEEEITARMAPYERAIKQLCTIPGVDRVTAWTLISELGLDMSVFETAAHVASWAGLCPGNHESAGKRMSNRTRKGNRWLRRGLCQSAWAVTHKKDCYLTAFFYRRAGRQGVRKAIVSTAHQILIVAYCVLRDGVSYRERGGAFFDLRHPERTRRRLQARLDRLAQAERNPLRPDA